MAGRGITFGQGGHISTIEFKGSWLKWVEKVTQKRSLRAGRNYEGETMSPTRH